MKDYYQENAKEYIGKTINADMSSLYSKFEKYLRPGSKILDLGFGSGRDSLYFLSKGYEVCHDIPLPPLQSLLHGISVVYIRI